MEVFELKPYGYCFAVIRAIELIKEVKQKHYDKNIYVFGMLVHNNDVVRHLEELGVITIDTNSIDKIQRLNEFSPNDVVVFTAHGHDEKYHDMRTFRVDRMKDIKVTKEPREGMKEFEQIDLATYTKRVS